MSVISCCLSVSLTLIEAPSFFRQFSHNIIILAVSLSFLNMLKLSCLMLFPLRKMRKTKTQHWQKSLMTYLHNGSTLEHNSNWFGKIMNASTISQRVYVCTSHVNSTPTLLTTVYIMSIHFLLSFPDFLVIFLLITILGNAHRPYINNTPALLTMIYICLFIFPIFSCFSDYIYINYHIRKCAQTM